MPERTFYGWKLLSVLWMIAFVNLAFPNYGASVINTVMAQEMKLDRQTLGSIFSVFMIMSGLPGPLVALSVQRLGIRRTLVIGSLLVTTGSVLMAAVVSTAWQAAIAFGVVVGTGAATGGMLGAQAGLARWFVRRRALALAILYTASAIGGFIASPLLNRVIIIANGNWRMGWWLIALISAAVALMAFIFVKEKPEDLGQQADGGTANVTKAFDSARPKRGAVHRADKDWSYREALSGSKYWLMVFSQMGVSCGYTVFLAHGVVHLQDLGYTRTVGAWAVSMIALTGLISKAIIATLGDRIDPRYLWAGFIAIFGLGQVLVVQADTYAQLIAFTTCMGMGFGGAVVCLAAVLSNYYGTKAFASLAGLAVAINTTLGAITPSLAGWFYDAGHGYGGVYYALAVWCIIGALVLFTLKPPVQIENTMALKPVD